jgi:signal recognition particle subunit SEC65
MTTPTTDRDLLELAAKAAGIHYDKEASKPHPKSGAFWGLWLVFDGEPPEHARRYWNPLTDDGDVLRLAVELGLSVEIHRDMTQPRPWLRVADRVGNWTYCGPRDYHGDELTQTRRTIVHAAAKIGKAMP